MEPAGRGNASEGMDVPVRKSRKDPSHRSSSKTSNKDARGDGVRNDLLRASGPEPTRAVTPTHTPMITSRSKLSDTVTSASGRVSQSSLADFVQTAPTVSILADLSKSRPDKKRPDIATSKSTEEMKSMRIDLNSYKFDRNQPKTASTPVLSSTPVFSSTHAPTMSPLRKSAWPSYGSPSPPPRRSGTPTLDEAREFGHHDHQVGGSRLDRGMPGHGQFTEGLHGAGPFHSHLLPGIPQGSAFTPQSLVMDYPRGFVGIPNKTPPVPDFAALFKDGFDRVINKIGSINNPKFAGDNLDGFKPSAGVADVTEVKQEELSEEDSAGEESFVSWSGQKLVNKTPAVVLSEEGVDAWKALKGLDNAGIEAGLFKKIVRKDKDLAFYSKGARCFSPQEKNLELPKCAGYKERDEKKLIQKDKALGAIGAALVAAVDAARECADDLSAAKQDFENDACEDLKKEAVETCAASTMWINDKVVVHLIKALKMTAVESALITSERRALAESEVSHDDMRKILADSPPDDVYLYGGAVKDSVQKARDASLLSKAFNQYGNRREKPWEKSSVYRPKNLRFKSNKRFRGKGQTWKKDDRKFFKGGFKKDQFKKE